MDLIPVTLSHVLSEVQPWMVCTPRGYLLSCNFVPSGQDVSSSCPPPLNPDNGFFNSSSPIPDEPYAVGSQLNQFCDYGYVLTEEDGKNGALMCNATSQWSGSQPQCVGTSELSQLILFRKFTFLWFANFSPSLELGQFQNHYTRKFEVALKIDFLVWKKPRCSAVIILAPVSEVLVNNKVTTETSETGLQPCLITLWYLWIWKNNVNCNAQCINVQFLKLENTRVQPIKVAVQLHWFPKSQRSMQENSPWASI